MVRHTGTWTMQTTRAWSRPAILSKAARGREQRIAVIVAEGQIVGGEGGPGQIAADELAALLEQAREDEEVRAVVLRINSPGGGMLASEMIRRQVEATSEAGKPVVVSMGAVAASGGYWVASAA